MQAAGEQSRSTPEIDSDAPTQTMKPEEQAPAQGIPSLTRAASSWVRPLID
jgi:hypothetical protein